MLAFTLCILAYKIGLSQNVGISSTSNFTPDASSALDINFSNKGLLVPRVALTASNLAGPISSPATSLLVYNTATAGTAPTNVLPGYYYWNGSAWVMLSTAAQTAASAWSTTGNAGIASATNFLGTTDNNPLLMRTNNIQRLFLDSCLAVGISPKFTAGTAKERFLVDAGNSSTNQTPKGAFNIISGKGYLDSYIQLNVQNLSPTANASSDIVTSNDAATESINYVDLGINSSGNTSSGILGGANTAYLLATGNDFAIGNGSANKNLLFFTSGTSSPATYTERMRIDPTGNVGIGVLSPTQKLDVAGSINAASSIIAQNNIVADASALNTGSAISPGLLFGSASSGEGIASKRSSGGNQYGIDFYSSSTNRMSITSSGNVGINLTAPTSTLAVNGSIAVVANTTRNSSYTLGASDYIIINTSNSNTPTYTLPGASTCQGRMYRIINHGGNSITIAFTNTSNSVISANGSTVTSVSTAAGSNVLEIVSDGTNWRKINN